MGNSGNPVSKKRKLTEMCLVFRSYMLDDEELNKLVNKYQEMTFLEGSKIMTLVEKHYLPPGSTK